MLQKLEQVAWFPTNERVGKTKIALFNYNNFVFCMWTGECILKPFWLELGDFELRLLCALSKLEDLNSAEVPRRTLAMWPRLSPELRPGRKTGGCSRSVPSSSREPTNMTVSHDCSEDEGSVNSDELEANLTNLQWEVKLVFWGCRNIDRQHDTLWPDYNKVSFTIKLHLHVFWFFWKKEECSFIE